MRVLNICLLTLTLIILIEGCARKRIEPDKSEGEPETKETKPEGEKDAPPGQNEPAQVKKVPPRVKKNNGAVSIAKDTTFATTPVDADGYIDYPAALNAQLRQGVTPENNANALIVRALGPRPIGQAMSPEYYESMGISSPPEDGKYFVNRKRFQTENSVVNFDAQVAATTQLPWTTQQYPHVANWLYVNEQPLRLFVEASQRTRYYHPMLPTNKDGWTSGLVGALLPTAQHSREAALALTTRAMWWIGQGDLNRAWQDILAVHRLARLIGRGCSLIENLTALNLDAIACKAGVVLLDRGKLGPTQLDRCLRDLQELPPLPDVASSLDLGERFVMLDGMMNVCRYGFAFTQHVGGKGDEDHSRIPEDFLAGINWDPAFKTANRIYDRLVAVARETNRAKWTEGAATIVTELREMKTRPAGDQELEVLFDPTVRGQAVGNIMVSLLTPAFDKVVNARDRQRQMVDNTLIAFALRWYYRVHERYPQTLDVLAPNYIPKIPIDYFSGRPLVYRPEQNGFLLYSVGANGVDDGGRGPDSVPPGDDITVMLPVPEPK